MEAMEELIKIAKLYSKGAINSVERNRHMNEIDEGEKLQQRHVDAVLVDFINFIAAKLGMDLGLYSEDLREKINADKK